MTPKERFIAALERRPITGVVPHFELVFFLTMEAFGRVHPSHRSYHQWNQMTEKERDLHRRDMADLYVATAETFQHSAIFIHPNPRTPDEEILQVNMVRRRETEPYFLLMHGDATFAMPGGNQIEAFSYRIADDPQGLKDEAARKVNAALERARRLKAETSLDGFALCADYCFNTGPFLSPEQFHVFVYPYLKELIAGYREMGFHVIKHTDGNIMPIIDQLVDAGPHALHSLDPQGGVDIAEVKARYGTRICLIGNVNCGLIDTGTQEEYRESVRYALTNGMPGYGYIFSTSNCVYTGMSLDRYRDILAIRQAEGVYR